MIETKVNNKINFAIGLSIAAVILCLLVFGLWIYEIIPHSIILPETFIGACVTLLFIIVTIAVCWQIFNAALGCAQLEHIDEYVEDKRATAVAYRDYFSRMDGIEFFVEPENTRSNYWLNAILLPNREEQQAFLQYTNDNGIMTRPIWELMNRLPMFENCETDHLTNTQMFADRVVNIPSSVR